MKAGTGAGVSDEADGRRRALFAAQFEMVQRGFDALLGLVREMEPEDGRRYGAALGRLLRAMEMEVEGHA